MDRLYRFLCLLLRHRWSNGFTGLSEPGVYHFCHRCGRVERKDEAHA